MNKTWGIIVDTTLQGAHTALVNIDDDKTKLIQVSSCHDNYSSAAKLAVNVEKMLEIYDLTMNDVTHVLLATHLITPPENACCSHGTSVT